VIERYAKAAGVGPAPAPWIDGSSDTTDPPATLLLCPGSRWATKQWPARHWVDLGKRWSGPVTLLGGPDEKHPIDRIAESIGPHATAVAESGFGNTFAAIRSGQLAVAGDTGLLHLCSAFGLPVVGLFGPTTSIDGFWWRPAGSPTSMAVERSMACRPCSRFGSETCPMGDHLCMSSICPSTVWEAVQTLLAEPST
jgi:heptosyltransferase-2